MNCGRITSVTAREAYSDRMKAAVLVTVITENGAVGKGMCTAGISVCSHEPQYLYDGGARFGGFGVAKAAQNINELLSPALIGMDAANQTACDGVIASLKSRIGLNAAAAASTAVLKAGAAALGIPLYEHLGGVRAFTLPAPAATAVTGSTRYGGSVNAGYKPSYAFVAYDFSSYTEASTALWEVFMNWSDAMQKKMGIKMQPIAGMAIPQGKIKNDYQIWDMLAETIESSGFSGRVGISVDIAAGCFYNRESGLYEGLFCREPKSREDMIALSEKMARDYPFVVLEDPLQEDDFEGFAQITARTGVQVICDDLTVTDMQRLRTAVEKKAGNALRIVVGQAGTVTEAALVAQTAYESGFGIAPCGERGEGIDACDYAVALNAGTAREYGMGYYGNRFLQIEKELGKRARFLGRCGLKGARFAL